MNVATIFVDQSEAQRKIRQYRALNKKQMTSEDRRLLNLYKAVSRGARVVNIKAAFQSAGLNEKGQPKLAIARADWRTVYFHPKYTIEVSDRSVWSSWNVPGVGAFTDTAEPNSQAYGKTICLPRGTFGGNLATRSIKSSVPHIPANIRPTINLSNFHILFEVQKWEEYPVDPFLLRRIDGYLFVVVAEWELTELEASLLGAMRTGN